MIMLPICQQNSKHGERTSGSTIQSPKRTRNCRSSSSNTRHSSRSSKTSRRETKYADNSIPRAYHQPTLHQKLVMSTQKIITSEQTTSSWRDHWILDARREPLPRSHILAVYAERGTCYHCIERADSVYIHMWGEPWGFETRGHRSP